MNKALLLSFALFALVPAGVLADDPLGPAKAPAAESIDISALQKELAELQSELHKARLALEKDERIVAIRALQSAASATNDYATARKRAAEARALSNELLSEQPGMSEKLARILEIGTLLRARLPAEKLRKGKRLPKTGGGQSPAEAAPDGNR